MKHLDQLPENYTGNFIVTHIYEGELWAHNFRHIGGTLFAYMDETWVEQDETLEEMYRDAEVVEFIVYEAANEENEEGWEEVAGEVAEVP